MMKRGVLYVLIVILATIALSGCNFVFSLILDPDLTVENIEMTEDTDGNVVGMTITFANYGGEAEDVDYSVYLSYSNQVNPATDFLLYSSTFDIKWNSEKVVNLSVENDIIPYITQNDLYVPEGSFYFGVFVDPADRIEEGDETDNDGTYGPYDFGGGGASDIPEDAYEYDDEPGAALFIDYTNGLPIDQTRNFHYPGDVDILEVFLVLGDTLYIETYPVAGGIDTDTYLELFDSSFNLVASNDDIDYPTNLYSSIGFTALESDTYYIVVSELGNDNIGDYNLYVSH